jgi:hypothetical protein
MFVAELPDGLRRGRQICAAMPVEPASTAMFRAEALLFLGQKDRALDTLRVYEPNDANLLGKQDARTIRYYRKPDAANEKDLLECVRNSKTRQMSVYYSLGLWQLAQGDRVAAQQHFQKCVALRYPYQRTYMICRAFLARMDRDPTWPSWIRPKR